MREGNPSGESEPGLRGDLGVSSEREGDRLEGIEGTGTLASAQHRTDGDSPTDPESAGLAHEGDPAKAADTDPVDAVNPAEVPSHESDPSRNPGHTHG